LKATDEFNGTVIVQNGFGQDEVNRPTVLKAGTPSLASATGFQNCIAKAA
jgi:hypothetical protein